MILISSWQCYKHNMRALVISSVICALVFVGAALPSPERRYERFDERKVYRAIPTTEKHLEILRNIKVRGEDGAFIRSPIFALNTEVDLMISSQQESKILSDFRESGLFYKIITDDVQYSIDNEKPEIGCSMQRGDRVASLNWTAYHRLNTIYDWLDELAETYPDWVEVVVIGSSYEGRLLKGVKITFDENNPGVFLEGGMHAREWISPAVVTYVINEILTSSNEEFNSLVRAHNWFMFPNTNPDGYEYSHTTDRMWRKTRKPYGNGCWGADPNRNWEFHWLDNGGGSTHPCGESYAGPEPFSESEVKALADYIGSVSDQFYIYLSLHSFSQRILFPYGYTYDHLDNYEESLLVGTRAAEALARRYGTRYIVGAIADTIYIASGSSTDYVKGVHKTPISFCYELRDNGIYGFLLPANQIIPTALEFIDSLIVVIEETQKLGYPKFHA